MKVLVITPSFKLLGGVANHYLGLKKYWNFDLRYEFYGKRSSIPAPLTFGFDLVKFTFKLVFARPDVVVVNPSLRKYQLFRDGIYVRLAGFFRIPVVTFIHGWDDRHAEELMKNGKSFRKIYNKSALIFVLAEEFRNKLVEIGITTRIQLTTTKVNDELLADFDLSVRDGKIREILFLARIVEEKGVLIAIHAFQLIQKDYPNLVLRVVGSGPDLGKAKELVNELKLENVLFRGAVFGKDISREFAAAQLYILPSYGEGMPTSVLEAMAFGMPVITRPLGGLKDFFLDPQMGKLIGSLDPEAYAQAVKEYLEDEKKCLATARCNYEYAHGRFMASRVVRQLENDIRSAIQQ